MNRTVPDASPTLAFTALEIRLLEQLAKVKDSRRSKAKSISTYLIKIARLGGYLARAGDAAPGNAVIWRGLSRLTDIELGFALAAKLVGNWKYDRTLTSLYLLQAPIRDCVRVMLPRISSLLTPFGAPLTPLIPILSSILVFRYWEEPMRRSIRRWLALVLF